MKLYELFIGFRYLKAKKSQGFISFNTVLSIAVVFLGVFIIIVVISVLNGFQSQIKDKILDVDSHITVTDVRGENSPSGIKNYAQLSHTIRKLKGVVSAEPIIQGQALFRFHSHITPVMVRGMGTRDNISPDVKKFIVEGDKDKFGRTGVLIGKEMAASYDIKLGHMIEVIVPKGRLTAQEGVEPGLGRYTVTGFFKTGYYDFDTKLIVISLPQAQALYEVGDTAWGIGVKIDDIFRMNQMSEFIQRSLNFRYITVTAEEKNLNLFYALKLEKLIMTIILFLVIISAAFTIMGTLVMVVMEKRRAIGILKTMGAGQKSIMSIFILEGFLIGVAGSLLGSVFGIAASLNLEPIIRRIEGLMNTVMALVYDIFNLGFYSRISIVPTNIYYIDAIPAEVKPEFVVFIAVFAVFISTVAAIFPAWSASRLKPVETIRYE